MNKVILMGRLTADPILETTTNGVSVVSFTLAVQRKVKNANGEYTADFIRCTAWRKTAEFIASYFIKGQMMAAVGELQTSTYEKNGQRHYVVDVSVSEVSFCGGRGGKDESTSPKADTPSISGFGSLNSADLPLPDNDDDLPF